MSAWVCINGCLASLFALIDYIFCNWGSGFHHCQKFCLVYILQTPKHISACSFYKCKFYIIWILHPQNYLHSSIQIICYLHRCLFIGKILVVNLGNATFSLDFHNTIVVCPVSVDIFMRIFRRINYLILFHIIIKITHFLMLF